MEMSIHREASPELYDAQRRLAVVLDNSTVSIFLMDHRQKCSYMSRAAEELTGFSFGEVSAMDKPLHDIIYHTHPDGSAYPIHEWAIDRAFPEHKKTQGEETFIHKIGYFYPVAFTASPVRDEGSCTIGTVIEARSVAMERRSREHQASLTNELNHRVKNTLATVQALAYQTFGSNLSKDAEPFYGRIAALFRAHDILTLAEWRAASLIEVLQTLMKPFSVDGQITYVGPNCSIPPKLAVSLAKVLHGFATNALKYGSLSSQGSVSITRTCRHDDNYLRAGFTCKEAGGPPVSEPTGRGFCSPLIKRQFKVKFDGNVELKFQPASLICNMQIEMPSNEETEDNGVQWS